jgi:hypothetical protein
MRITIGNALLGDYSGDNIPVGGFVASATGDTQRGRGTCTGLARLRMRGGVVASFTVPTKRTFTTVSDAQKWICETAKVGGYEGLLRFVYASGAETRFDWAVARPSNLSHQGVLVTAVWAIEAGRPLT